MFLISLQRNFPSPSANCSGISAGSATIKITTKKAISRTVRIQGANTQPYVMKLFELLTGEAPNTNAYIAGDRGRVSLIVAMQAAFEEGRSHFEKTGKAVTEDKNEIAQAFAIFNQTLNADTLVA